MTYSTNIFLASITALACCICSMATGFIPTENGLTKEQSG